MNKVQWYVKYFSLVNFILTYTIDNNGSKKEEITNNNVKNINKIELFFT